MATRPPDAFLSYTHFDDRRGDISAFRGHLEHAVQELTGEPFEIFQDVDGIGLGQRWSGKLDEMLEQVRFFIPIVTPSYFKSQACRDELEKFLRAEADRGRDDLVLPIYYIDSDTLENTDRRAADPLAAAIHKRQRHDWRPLRFSSFSTKTVKTAFYKLAREIVRARRRAMPDVAERAESQISAGRPKQTTKVPPSPPEMSTGSQLKPGTVFRDIDAPWCPELVVIPPGEFMMGSPEGEEERYQDEGPQHLVTIGYTLAVGRYPVTFDEYDLFAGSTGRRQPGDQGWSRKRRPVIDVSWDDAKAYVEWLASDTGQAYCLLSEAEWEYACRARTTARYWWGDEIAPKNANYGESVGETTEVGSYPANRWGLCDMHGNVWEWVEDCWNDSYNGVPDDGGPWTSDDCSRRVLRGGSWYDHSRNLRSACRNRLDTGNRDSTTGFRVARALSEQPAVNSAKGAHGGDLKYHDPALSGQVTFNYSNNDGRYSIGRNEFFFETMWSKADDRSIHLYNDPPSIAGVAEAPKLQGYEEVRDPTSYDMSSRARTIEEGEHAILKNRHNKYAVLKVLDIKDRTRSDSVDELTFKFWILTDTS